MTYETDLGTELERAAKADQIRKARIRTNVEDAVTVLVLMLFALIVGIRVQAVYLTHEPQAPAWQCSAEDETVVHVEDPTYPDGDGSWACVHVDALETIP